MVEKTSSTGSTITWTIKKGQRYGLIPFTDGVEWERPTLHYNIYIPTRRASRQYFGSNAKLPYPYVKALRIWRWHLIFQGQIEMVSVELFAPIDCRHTDKMSRTSRRKSTGRSNMA